MTGNELIALMAERGWATRPFADALGVSHSTVMRWRGRGDEPLHPLYVHAIRAALRRKPPAPAPSTRHDWRERRGEAVTRAG